MSDMKPNKYPMSDVEIKVLSMRKQGYSFSKISDILGFKHYQQSQGIYNGALSKLRAVKYVSNTDPALLQAANEEGYSWRTVIQLYNFLHKKNMLNMYYRVSDADLEKIKWSKSEFKTIVLAAKRLHNRLS